MLDLHALLDARQLMDVFASNTVTDSAAEHQILKQK